jgi:hypothetical protein
MSLHILHVLAQLEDEVKANISEEQKREFYELGQSAMREYLKEHPTPAEDIDVLIERTGVLLDNFDGDLQTAIFEAVADYSINYGHWKELGLSDWLDDVVLPMIQEAVGYQTSDVGEKEQELMLHPPVEKKDIELKQMQANMEALAEVVVDGLQIAEEYYLENILFNELEDALPAGESEGIDVEMPFETERVDHAAL